ncbi:MAG: amidohydrolase, partial [Gammaproteobacteria bacterium]
MTVSLLSARWIVTGTTTENVPDIHKNAALAHEDGVILAIGSLEDMRRDYPGAPETAYPHHLILPGLVNCHHHIGLTPLQLGAPDYALELWFAARLSFRSVDPYLDTLYSAFE